MERCLDWHRKLQYGKTKGLKWFGRKYQQLPAPIYRLHPELIQDLARNFLESFEAALLTICSKAFRYLLGVQYLQICREDLEQKNKLLSVWEKEFPEMVHCVPCTKFHHISTAPYVNLKWNCQSLERHIRPSGPPRDRFKFIYIQALLKRYRFGLDIKQYIKALSHEHSSLVYPTGPQFYSLCEMRIVSGELLVRVQDWHFYPAEVLTRRFPTDVYFPLYLGCFHFEDGSVNGQLQDLLMGKSFDWEFVNRPDHYGGLRQCRFCYTEFQFDIIQFLDLAAERPNKLRLHDRYIATIKTTWANYGNGDPDVDGKYMLQYMDEWQEPRIIIPRTVHNPVTRELGSIRVAFEHGKEFHFESVVSREKKKVMKALLIRNDEILAHRKHPKFSTLPSPHNNY